MSQQHPRCFVGGWSVVGWLVVGQPILGPGIFARVLQMARYTLGVLWCIDKAESPIQSSLSKKARQKSRSSLRLFVGIAKGLPLIFENLTFGCFKNCPHLFLRQKPFGG